jgi:hypothetical protein
MGKRDGIHVLIGIDLTCAFLISSMLNIDVILSSAASTYIECMSDGHLKNA